MNETVVAGSQARHAAERQGASPRFRLWCARVHRRFSFIAALFLVSGSTGLLYEVAFSKLLGYVFGATAYAVSTVLAAYAVAPNTYPRSFENATS